MADADELFYKAEYCRRLAGETDPPTGRILLELADQYEDEAICSWHIRPVHQSKSMVEKKRAAPQHRTLKAATVEFGGGAIDCAVRNLSKTGAALDVPTPVGIPGEFHLGEPERRLRFACRAVWRKASRIGVRFD
jgi:hypothetical protein